jgi:alpha-galactosidase
MSVSAHCQVPWLRNSWLTVSVRDSDGSFELRAEGLRDPVLTARVGAEINHQWIFSSDYPKPQVVESAFHDALGQGRQLEVSFSQAAGHPNLRYVLHLYNEHPYGDI